MSIEDRILTEEYYWSELDVGPARVTQPPFKLEKLPHVDAVIISHNHCKFSRLTFSEEILISNFR